MDPATKPPKVELGECWARDGLQSVRAIVPTERKVMIINKLSDLGYSRIEATSFANSRYLPQFSDQLDVLKLIKRRPGVQYIGLVPNYRGMESALKALDEGYGVDVIYVGLSASEAHNLANMNKTVSENQKELEPIMKKALDNGLEVMAWVSTSFGCPISGDVPVEMVLDLALWFVDQGAGNIAVGDTTGMANPVSVRKFYDHLVPRLPDGATATAHFHDTRGTGLANCVAALECGIRSFDCSLGAIGGQPANDQPRYHTGYTGNVSSEDLICMLAEMGVDTGISIDALIETSLLAEAVLGGPQRSQVTRCGPVRHRPATS